jgi:DNA-binding PadR family transcriptional regulator
MQSPVNWALLGLVIERPSYAYELAQRFERTYEGALSLSSTSHVYTALGTLQDRALIEEIPGTREGRQPKPFYRATPNGVSEYHDWLVAEFRDDRRRQRLFVLQLVALTRDPATALQIVDRFEEACLHEAARTPIAPRNGPSADPGAELFDRLLAEESRLLVGGRLAWVQYMRRELKALADTRAAAR